MKVSSKLLSRRERGLKSFQAGRHKMVENWVNNITEMRRNGRCEIDQNKHLLQIIAYNLMALSADNLKLGFMEGIRQRYDKRLSKHKINSA